MELEKQLSETTNKAAPLETEAGIHRPIPSSALHIRVNVVDVLSDYAVAGQLVGFTPGEVAILVAEPMFEQRTVDVELSSFKFTGHTLYCRERKGQYETHISIDDVDRAGMRRAPRFPVAIPAELMSSDAEPVPGTIRDISRDGMGIESPLALEPGQPIAIASEPAFVFAVVRYCNPIQGGRFRAGVEMHHLFEKPQPQVNHLHPNVLGDLWRKWFVKTDINVVARRPGIAK